MVFVMAILADELFISDRTEDCGSSLYLCVTSQPCCQRAGVKGGLLWVERLLVTQSISLHLTEEWTPLWGDDVTYSRSQSIWRQSQLVYAFPTSSSVSFSLLSLGIRVFPEHSAAFWIPNTSCTIFPQIAPRSMSANQSSGNIYSEIRKGIEWGSMDSFGTENITCRVGN